MVNGSIASHRLSWDQIVALSYAAEQLFLAAQLLTSDTVALDYAIPKSCDHLRRLLEHRSLLPSYLITWINECVESCRPLRRFAGPSLEHRAESEQLATAILQVLEEVRRVLKEQNEAPAVWQRRAA